MERLFKETMIPPRKLNQEKDTSPKIMYDPPPDYAGTPERFVLFSSTMDSNYGFFSPLTAFLWTKMDWKPVVIVVGTAKDWEEDALGRILRDNILKAGGLVVYLPYDISLFCKFNPGNTAQISRILAGFISEKVIPEGSYILISDGDIW